MKNQSVQEVSKLKQAQPKEQFAKTDSRYWKGRLFRNAFTRDGGKHEVTDWCIKLAYGGRRETINLRTPNQATAATKAAALYKQLVTEGWEAVLATYKPKKAPEKPKAATIGDLFAQVRATASYRPSTFMAYVQSLRTIASSIAGVGHKSEVATSPPSEPIIKPRQGCKILGKDQWRQAVDALPLEILAAENIQKWRLAYVARAGNAPDARRRAESSATALIRNARALFTEKALHFAKDSLALPNPLPFTGIKLGKKPTGKYLSRIDATELIAAARQELASNPSRYEEFKLFCLALLCGLRKAEADSLLWRQVDFNAALIRIEPSEYFTPKSEDSIGEIDLEPELLALLRGWKAQATGPFVVESALEPRYPVGGSRWYRCQMHFVNLYAWLKSKGITARKPLHELRKELGAVLASKLGIFAAQSVLRHAQIATTAAYYADKKGRISAGLGALLAAPENVTPFPSSYESEPKIQAVI